MVDTTRNNGLICQALQNKNEKGEFASSISQLVAICETEGFIPRYYVEQPNDRVDEVLKDNQMYLYRLVTEEMNLGNLIENAVRTMTEEENKKEDEDVDDADLMNYDKEELQTEDFEELNEFLNAEREADEEYYERSAG